MNNSLLSFLLIFLIAPAFGQVAQTGYQYHVDLNKVVNDQLLVTLETPPIDAKEIKFHLPKIVPGTYSIYDFGRFVSDLRAFNTKGKELKVNRKDDNTWVISKAKKLTKITYSVEDTWDTDKDNPIFEPAGTNIESERNFVFNNHGVFGFFEGMESQPFYVTVDRPANFYGATSLKKTGGDKDTDIFFASSYYDLVDNPIMFGRPDTTIIKVGNADVLIATFSATGKISSRFLAKEIGPILQGQMEYLGGILPVDRYTFLFYLTDGFTASGGYGALEHNYSSMYVLPEMDEEQIAQMVRDVAAHEFFHIVTPLNIHSEEIHFFDFIHPKMSQHLWMYEGVTEYSAGHVQVKQRLMPIENYLEVLADKLRGADQYNDELPFTEMSKGALDKYKEEYTNVYQKGALIGMCIDLKLRIDSGGKYGIQDLLKDLSLNYGKDKPFKDDELFSKIEEIAGKDIRSFLDKYVAGPDPLPIRELLGQVGIDYYPVKMIKQKTLGGLENALGFNPKTTKFFIQNDWMLDDFGKRIGFKKNDVLVKWDGKDLNIETINNVMNEYFINSKEGDDLSVTIERSGKVVELNGKVETIEMEVEHSFELNENPSATQLGLRKSWLGDYRMAADSIPASSGSK